jgi:hypothetical protein
VTRHEVNRSGSLCYPPGRQPRARPFLASLRNGNESDPRSHSSEAPGRSLPSDGIPIALGRPGNGHKYDGCDEVVAITLLMMEPAKDSKSFLLHGDCYIIWNTERLTLKS